MPLLNSRKLPSGEVHAQQEGVKAETSELLPMIPECPSRLCLGEDSLGRQEYKVQVSVMLWTKTL